MIFITIILTCAKQALTSTEELENLTKLCVTMTCEQCNLIIVSNQREINPIHKRSAHYIFTSWLKPLASKDVDWNLRLCQFPELFLSGSNTRF